jgi:hypothetical protein
LASPPSSSSCAASSLELSSVSLLTTLARVTNGGPPASSSSPAAPTADSEAPGVDKGVLLGSAAAAAAEEADEGPAYWPIFQNINDCPPCKRSGFANDEVRLAMADSSLVLPLLAALSASDGFRALSSVITVVVDSPRAIAARASRFCSEMRGTLLLPRAAARSDTTGLCGDGFVVCEVVELATLAVRLRLAAALPLAVVVPVRPSMSARQRSMRSRDGWLEMLAERDLPRMVSSPPSRASLAVVAVAVAVAVRVCGVNDNEEGRTTGVLSERMEPGRALECGPPPEMEVLREEPRARRR